MNLQELWLLKIHNDLILAIVVRSLHSFFSTLIPAAFDTADHSILRTRLQNWFGLDGLSLDWFSSYLSLDFALRQSQSISGVGTTGSSGSADPPLFGARGPAGSGPPYFIY